MCPGGVAYQCGARCWRHFQGLVQHGFANLVFFSHITWICKTNEASRLPEAMLDRLEVFESDSAGCAEGLLATRCG